ncbi:MAG: DUF502 domain-containing protein [Halobacteriaceae archaeon]
MRWLSKKTIRDSFISGLIVVAPLIITIFIFKLIFNWILGFINPFIFGLQLPRLTGNIELVAQLLAIGLMIVGITLIGLFANLNIGRRTLGNIGRFVDFIPLFRTVYGNIRQVATSITEHSTAYESAVYVEYPRLEVYSIGLVTGESPTSIEDVAGQEVYNVYVPASPNPTNGSLQLVPEERIHESDLSVGQAFRMLMTTGISENQEDIKGMPLPEEQMDQK